MSKELNKGFSDMSKMAHECVNMKTDSLTQLQTLFTMVQNYEKTNPNESKALNDFIGKRCEYKKHDLF